MTSAPHPANAPVRSLPLPAPGKWWALERNAASVDCFQVIAALALSAHFITQCREIPSLFSFSSLEELQYLSSNATVRAPTWFTSRASPELLQAILAAAALLSFGIAMGIAPRFLATVVYAISATTYRTLFPIAGLDDYLVDVTALFLALGPAGRSASVLTALRRRSGESKPVVSGIPALLYLSFVAFTYLTSTISELSGTTAGEGSYLATAVRLLPAAFVLPIPGLAVAGVAFQLGVHGYFLATSHSLFTNLVLPATALLFWGEREPPSCRAKILDAGAIIAVVVGVLFVAVSHPWAEIAGAPVATRAFGDLGLVRPSTSDSPEEDATLSFSVAQIGSSATRTISLQRQGRLARRLVSELGNEAADRARRFAYAKALVARYCAAQGYAGQHGTMDWSDANSKRSIVEFDCGEQGTLAEIR